MSRSKIFAGRVDIQLADSVGISAVIVYAPVARIVFPARNVARMMVKRSLCAVRFICERVSCVIDVRRAAKAQAMCRSALWCASVRRAAFNSDCRSSGGTRLGCCRMEALLSCLIAPVLSPITFTFLSSSIFSRVPKWLSLVDGCHDCFSIQCSAVEMCVRPW